MVFHPPDDDPRCLSVPADHDHVGCIAIAMFSRLPKLWIMLADPSVDLSHDFGGVVVREAEGPLERDRLIPPALAFHAQRVPGQLGFGDTEPLAALPLEIRLVGVVVFERGIGDQHAVFDPRSIPYSGNSLSKKAMRSNRSS